MHIVLNLTEPATYGCGFALPELISPEMRWQVLLATLWANSCRSYDICQW